MILTPLGFFKVNSHANQSHPLSIQVKDGCRSMADFDCAVSRNLKSQFFGKPVIFYRLGKIRALEPWFCGIGIPRQPYDKTWFDAPLAFSGIGGFQRETRAGAGIPQAHGFDIIPDCAFANRAGRKLFDPIRRSFRRHRREDIQNPRDAADLQWFRGFGTPAAGPAWPSDQAQP